jgi:RNA recognition motif-containing protein
MAKKLYVGNLPFSFNDELMRQTFAPFGSVTSARVIIDRDSGRSKGFGFVEMTNDQEAAEAIEKLNGSSQGGRNITVSEARPQAPRTGGGRF